MNTVLILRGIPGNGKTSFADTLKMLYPNTVICCADDFLINNKGEYEWSPSRVRMAHVSCKALFVCSLQSKYPFIIVANTSTKESDVNEYRNLAINNGYKVFVTTVENWHGGSDTHNVPKEVKASMKDNLIKSIKL